MNQSPVAQRSQVDSFQRLHAYTQRGEYKSLNLEENNQRTWSDSLKYWTSSKGTQTPWQKKTSEALQNWLNSKGFDEAAIQEFMKKDFVTEALKSESNFTEEQQLQFQKEIKVLAESTETRYLEDFKMYLKLPSKFSLAAREVVKDKFEKNWGQQVNVKKIPNDKIKAFRVKVLQQNIKPREAIKQLFEGNDEQFIDGLSKLEIYAKQNPDRLEWARAELSKKSANPIAVYEGTAENSEAEELELLAQSVIPGQV